MTEIVKYSNDLHKLKIGNFGEMEQNLLFGILANCRNKYDEFVMTLAELNEFSPSRKYTANEMLQKALSLRESIFKLDFSVIKSKDENYHEQDIYNLFSRFTICYNGKKNDFKNAELTEIRLKVNEDFRELIANLTKEFTQYELEEFIFLNSRYTKTIYRYLKQFRTTGIWRVSWDDFKEILGIPNSYEMRDINKRILEPSIKQLQEPLNLFERSRTPFKNLKCTKIKGKGRGRGGTVVAIEFTFDKQTAEGKTITKIMGQEIAPSHAKEYKEPQKLEPIFIQKLMELAKKKGEIVYFGKWYHLHNFIKNDKKITLCLSRQKSIFNGFYADITLAQAEQLAKDNNLI